MSDLFKRLEETDWSEHEKRMEEYYQEAQQKKAAMQLPESPIDNPYWEVVKTLPHESMGWSTGFTPEAHPIRSLLKPDQPSQPDRASLVQKYSWAIPNPDALQFIVNTLNGRAVVELGAGTGYWAWMLSQMGVDVLAFDKHPPSEGENFYHSPKETVPYEYTEDDHRQNQERWQPLIESLTDMAEYYISRGEKVPASMAVQIEQGVPELPVLGTRKQPTGEPGAEYYPIRRGSTKSLDLPECDGRVLLLCWPPYDKDFGYEAIKQFRGDTVIFIGEAHGGCTGSDEMFELLEAEWEVADEYWDGFTQWSGIHDGIMIYTRKRP